MRIALGSDHAGLALKQVLIDHFKGRDIAYYDFGTFCERPADYPDIVFPVVRGVIAKEFKFGILICGTGIGVSMTANRFQGIRAALCGDPYSARCAREHNNANILTLGARIIGPGLALEIVEVFLQATFQGGRHQRRLDKIKLLSDPS